MACVTLLVPFSKPVQQKRSNHRWQRCTAAAVKQKYKNFDDLLSRSDVPVLIDFYATWCGPCVMMADALNQVAPQLKEQLTVVKIDTDKYGSVAARYGVQALPTLILFKSGKPVERMDGFVPAPELLEKLKALLARKD